MHKNFIIAVKLLILCLVMLWIVRSFDPQHWKVLVEQKKHWGLLAISLAVVLTAHVLSYLRWHVFVHTLGVPFTRLEAIRLGFLGNLFNFVSLGAVGGDLFRAIAAARQAGKKRPEVIASVMVDRALGLLGLVIVAAVSLQFFGTALSPTLHWIRIAAWLVSAIGLTCLILIAFAGHNLPLKMLHNMPFIGHTLHRMASAGMIFEGRPSLVVLLVGMSCVVHVFLTIGMFLISIAIYSETPTLFEHFLTIPPAFAAAALPLSPGGLGVQEIAIAKLFEELPDLPESYSGLIVAAMYRLELFIVAAVGGIYYALGTKDIRQLKSDNH